MMHSHSFCIALIAATSDSLNPCCNGWCTRTMQTQSSLLLKKVLILVVMDDALVQCPFSHNALNGRLNPCCNGWCTRTETAEVVASQYGVLILVVMDDALVLVQDEAAYKASGSLNPCCNGWCTRTLWQMVLQVLKMLVLILVVMDDALVPKEDGTYAIGETNVLILVVMDDALVH